MELGPDKKKATCSSNDRLSNLPQDVLHYLLSYVETRDVIRMSVLSKRWRFVWVSMPYLYFSALPFRGYKEKYKDFLWLTLSLRDGCDIKRLRMDWRSLSDDQECVNRLLLVTARLNVEEIHLDGFGWLPGCPLDSKSFRVLKFTDSKILRPPRLRGVSKLTSLCLMDVRVEVYNFGPKLFSRLPFLEDLKMADCMMGTVRYFEVNATKLKILTFTNSMYCPDAFKGALRVVAPNLNSFYYAGPLLTDYSMENLSSLHSASVYITTSSLFERGHHLFKLVRGFHDVEVLRLSSRLLTELSVNADKPECFLNRLYNLKCLKLCVSGSHLHMESFFYLLEHSPNLDTLVLDFQKDQFVNDCGPSLQEACLMDHLKTVEISNFEGRPLELELVKFLLSNANVLQTMAIKYKNRGLKEESFEKVLAFPKASPHVDISFPGFGKKRIFWESEKHYYEFSESESDSE